MVRGYANESRTRREPEGFPLNFSQSGRLCDLRQDFIGPGGG